MSLQAMPSWLLCTPMLPLPHKLACSCLSLRCIPWLQDELRLMKTQDAGYLTLKSQAEAKVRASRLLLLFLVGAEPP